MVRRMKALSTSFLFATVTSVFAAGCSSSSGATKTSPPDAGADSSVTDASEMDAAVDSGIEDAGAEAAPDAADAAPKAGCGGASGDSAAPITVNGTVESVWTGLTTEVQVTIGSQTTMSSSYGTFTFDCVVPPYDVTLYDQTSGMQHTYLGLTRPDPYLAIQAYEYPEMTYQHQPISGSLTMGGAAIDAGMSNAYMVIMDDTLDLGDTHGSTFDFITYLPGPLPLPLTLYGFTYTTLASGGLASIQALGTTNVMATTTPLSNLTIPLDPKNVVASTLSGTLSLPSGATNPVALMYLGNRPTFNVAEDVPGASFSYATFKSPLPWLLEVGADVPNEGGCWTYYPGLVGDENLSVVLPSGSTVTSPSGATFDPTTQNFTWSHVAGSVHEVLLSTGAAPQWAVITDRDSILLPFTLASGQYYYWTLITYMPAASIDALTASASTLKVLSPNLAPTVAQSSCNVQGGFQL
jgi:hypothetical protein